MANMWRSFLYCLCVVAAPVHGTSEIECGPCHCQWNNQNELVANCFAKKLDHIPRSIPNYVGILNLKDNSITRLPANGLAKFTILKILDLSSNDITGFNADSFTGATNLVELYLRGNDMNMTSATYPAGMFRTQKNLRTLDIASKKQQNDMEYPIDALRDLVALEAFYANGLQELTFHRGFLHLTKLTNVTISGKYGSCKSHHITTDSFVGLKYVRHLDISDCTIYNISRAAFEPLAASIQTIDMSNNRQLGLDNFGEAMYGLRNSHIKVINASALVTTYAVGVSLKAKHVKYLSTTGIKQIIFDANRLETFEDTVPGLFPDLEIFSMNENRPTFGLYLLSLSAVSKLKTVHTSRQYLTDKPPLPNIIESIQPNRFFNNNYNTGLADKTPVFPCTDHTCQSEDNIEQNLQDTPIDMGWHLHVPVPTSIQFINASNSRLEYELGTLHFTQNKLAILDLSSNYFRKWIGPITPLNYLIFLDLSTNYCTHVSQYFFDSCYRLRTLNISHNYLAESLWNDTKGLIFGKLQELETLSLSYNNIMNLPELLLQNNSYLRNLDLSGNALETWSLQIQHMRHLRFVDISNNRFEAIPEDLRFQVNDIIRNRNESFTIGLKGNFLKCTCKTLESLQWMLQINVQDDKETRCQLENEEFTTFQNLDDIVEKLIRDCQTIYPIIITTSICILVFFTIVFAGFVYRYRWKLRYMYYTTRRKYRGYQRIIDEGELFTYDAFISYADEDRKFVMIDMINILEKKYGLRLCIHHRDFMLGEAITANIINAIQSSRKTIVILSPNFLKSEWCQYEVRMARMESVHMERDLLGVIWLHDIPNVEQISGDIFAEISRASYLKYPGEASSAHESSATNVHDEFWATVKEAITL